MARKNARRTGRATGSGRPGPGRRAAPVRASPTRKAPTAAEAPTSSASPATTRVDAQHAQQQLLGSGWDSSRPMRWPQRWAAAKAAATAARRPRRPSRPATRCRRGQDGEQRQVGGHREVLEHQHRQHRGGLPIAQSAQVVEQPGDDAGGGDLGRTRPGPGCRPGPGRSASRPRHRGGVERRGRRGGGRWRRRLTVNSRRELQAEGQ